jgi:hypothetical protein
MDLRGFKAERSGGVGEDRETERGTRGARQEREAQALMGGESVRGRSGAFYIPLLWLALARKPLLELLLQICHSYL